MIDSLQCRGCYNDFYNGEGAKECWNLKTAKMESSLLIHVDQPPPYHQAPKMRPNCYKAQGFVTVKPNRLDSKGYWKA